MMGVTGVQVVRELGGLGLTALGANCGNNLPETEAALAEMRAELSAAHLDVLLIAKANAGMPQWEGDKLVYNGTPEVMAAYAHRVRENGVQLIGGCCGSGPAHIALMRQVLDGAAPGARHPVCGARRRGRCESGHRRGPHAGPACAAWVECTKLDSPRI